MDRAETDIFRRMQQTPVPDAEVDEFTVDGSDHLQDWLCAPDAVFTLSERRMTVEEQAAFATAKQKELQSLFDNSVWSSTNEADPARTMKARFLQKWRTGEDGQPETKARLVIQGFRDLDALEGTWKPARLQQTGLPDRCCWQWPLSDNGPCTRPKWLQHSCKEMRNSVCVREITRRRAKMIGEEHMRLDKPMYP